MIGSSNTGIETKIKTKIKIFMAILLSNIRGLMKHKLLKGFTQYAPI